MGVASRFRVTGVRIVIKLSFSEQARDNALVKLVPRTRWFYVSFKKLRVCFDYCFTVHIFFFILS